MIDLPRQNGPNGRDARGRFAPGNPGGPGNPFAKRVGRLRTALLRAVSPDDLRAVVAKMVAMAKSGDVAAAKLVLERTMGPPQPIDVLERLERLEELVRAEIAQ